MKLSKLLSIIKGLIEKTKIDSIIRKYLLNHELLAKVLLFTSCFITGAATIILTVLIDIGVLSFNAEDVTLEGITFTLTVITV